MLTTTSTILYWEYFNMLTHVAKKNSTYKYLQSTCMFFFLCSIEAVMFKSYCYIEKVSVLVSNNRLYWVYHEYFYVKVGTNKILVFLYIGQLSNLFRHAFNAFNWKSFSFKFHVKYQVASEFHCYRQWLY